MRPPRSFKRTDGFEPKDFIHSGLDHINAAENLFKASSSFLDSAGYVAHLGFELLLKAWHLEAFGEFFATHSLNELISQLRDKGQQVDLSAEELVTLKIADEYGELRYPNPHQGTEVGEDDWEKLEVLLESIWEQTPIVFDVYFASIDSTRKGGRVLMEREIDAS